MSMSFPIIGQESEAGSSPSDPKLKGKDYGGNVSVVSLGCAKNTVDSEVMLGALVEKGYRFTPEPKDAEVVLVNTCSFLESAVKDGIDTILSLAELKKTARLRSLIVAGCMVERYGEDLKESLPEVDLFISTDELTDIANLAETTNASLDVSRRPYFLHDESSPRVSFSESAHSVYLKVSEGCDRPCSFCIIPKLRGGFRSRSIESLLGESKNLLDSGAREINLIAQDLTAYGDDFLIDGKKSRGGRHLINLLEGLNDLDERKYWLRLFYAYPIGVSKDLMEAISGLPKVCNYLDMPIQHISGPVLKRMKRPLGGKRTKELIYNMRAWAPEVSLRTTFIVGFPGETDEDIKDLEEFLLEGHFEQAGVFVYSQEKEAESFSFDDQVPEEEKIERQQRVLEAQRKSLQKKLAERVGQEIEVIIDGLDEDSSGEEKLIGRGQHQGLEVDSRVLLAATSYEDTKASIESGSFQTVRITGHDDYDLFGEIIK